MPSAIPRDDARSRPSFFGLLQLRYCWMPTWCGWIVLLALVLALAVLLVRIVHPFLAVQEFRPGGLLVLEGWAPDHVLTEALAETQRHAYEGILVTGVPIAKGAPLVEYSDYAHMTVITLAEMGADPDRLHVAVTPEVIRDRTYSMGIALRDWLREHPEAPENINLMSVGAHARRSRLLVEKALGREVGIIAVADQEYDPRHWWRSSAGVRTIIGEVIAYLYARLIFSEPAR